MSNLVISLIQLYAIILLAFLILREFVGEQWGIIALFNSVGPILLMIAAGLMFLCLVVRRFRLAAYLLPSSLMFFVLFGPSLLPKNTPPTDSFQPISLLTFNAFSEQTPAENIEQIIQDVDADVVLLQELSVEDGWHLDDTLADNYPHRAIHTLPNAWGRGMAVFSRYPIVSDEYWLINRAHQRVELNFEGNSLVIYNTRPLFPFSQGGFAAHANEVALILEMAQKENDRVILAGDFNMSELSEPYSWITAEFVDAFRAVGSGMGFTFPAGPPDIDALPGVVRNLIVLPLARLDYVFHSEGLTTLDAQVWSTSGGSDHRPLWVELAISK